MSRIRTVKPRLFKHTGLFDAEKETGLPLRLAFIGLFTKADREGRFAWDARELRTDVLPYDEDVDFSRVLDALATRGFIRKYRVGNRDYGCFPTWKDHQVINNREAESFLPSPDEDEGVEPVLTRAPRVPDASVTPLKSAQAEGKGREGERSSVPIGTDADASRPPLVVVCKPLPLSLVEPIDGDWAQTLFRPGLEWLANRTGKQPNAVRSVLGKWLQACEQNHERVFRLLIEAERQEIADPIGWITKGLEARGANGKQRKPDAALAGLAAATFG